MELAVSLCFISAVLMTSAVSHANSIGETSDPTPVPWPEQFHSVLYINNSGSLQVTDLWYDWPKGRNFNIIQKQLGRLLYDLEWNNGTSFYYYLDKNECKIRHFEVGILRPNWLEGANYLGVQRVDGFLCNVWEKVDFIWYYEDTVTKRPVHWLFFTGMSVHVITFEVGAVLEDEKWQAPSYCFEGDKIDEKWQAPSYCFEGDKIVEDEDGVGLTRRISEKKLGTVPLNKGPIYQKPWRRVLAGFNS